MGSFKKPYYVNGSIWWYITLLLVHDINIEKPCIHGDLKMNLKDCLFWNYSSLWMSFTNMWYKLNGLFFCRWLTQTLIVVWENCLHPFLLWHSWAKISFHVVTWNLEKSRLSDGNLKPIQRWNLAIHNIKY